MLLGVLLVFGIGRCAGQRVIIYFIYVCHYMLLGVLWYSESEGVPVKTNLHISACFRGKYT